MVEQRIENPRVGSSILSLATSLAAITLTACGGLGAFGPFEDDCEATCRIAARELDACLDDVDWAELGATGELDWRQQCQEDWEVMRRDLSELQRDQALASCAEMREVARTATCEELEALYRP